MLNTKEACIYSGVSKPTLLKAKTPYSEGNKKGWKLYDPKILDEYFPNAPKIMPNKKNIPVVAPAVPEIQINVAEHQSTFKNILTKVKEVRGDSFQQEVAASLVESLIKATILENYYFEQLQFTPESRDIFQSWKQSLDTKMNITKRIGL